MGLRVLQLGITNIQAAGAMYVNLVLRESCHKVARAVSGGKGWEGMRADVVPHRLLQAAGHDALGALTPSSVPVCCVCLGVDCDV